jgi:hypothetical protein
MVRLRGLEPLTYRSGICRSIQLSYRRIGHPPDQKTRSAARSIRQHMDNGVIAASQLLFTMKNGVRDGNRTRNPQIHNLVL